MNIPSTLAVSQPIASSFEKSTWTHPDGSKRALYRWNGASPPDTPALVFVHGFGEHMGRFQSFVDGLSPLGLSAVGYDHLGHGHSDGQRGDAANVDALADDFGLILPTLLDLAGAQQAIVLGHSMGALTLARYLTRGRASSAILAAILSGPAFVIPKTPVVRLKVAIGRVLAKLWPKLSFPAGVDPCGLSHDPQVVADYKSDPLVHGMISARLGKSLIDDGERFTDDASNLAIPTLLYHGGHDPIASIEGSRRFARQAPKNLLTYYEWPGLFHEPHHEVAGDRAKLFQYIRDWLAPIISKTRPARG
jgi:alpha-beta hydrolase superfamily lysophospholipase